MASSVTGATAQVVAVILAVAGAFSYAVASVTQQRMAAQLTSTRAFDPAVLVRLARRRRWLLGLVAVLCGYLMQAGALDLGRLVVVEPVFPIGLLFALILAARAEGRRLRRTEWTAAVAAVGGLALFLVAAQPSGGHRSAGTGPLALVAVGAIVIAGVCCVIASRVAKAHRAVALSIAGGIGAGVTDALTKSVAALLGVAKFAIFADLRLYLLIAVGLLTFTLQQNGFRAAGLPASLPAFAVLEPLVGSMLGLVIYHEHVGGGPARIAVEAVAVLAAGWGIVQLANSVIVELVRLAATTTDEAQAEPPAGAGLAGRLPLVPPADQGPIVPFAAPPADPAA